jgi:parallel beta-helix repeat protein
MIPAAATPTTASPAPSHCAGPPLTSQSQVQPNTSYCGGVVHGRIVLADGDSWTGGDVSGATTGRQQGAVQCGSPCWLTDLYVHDNPNAFAGIYAPRGDFSGPMVVRGGRVTGSGSLGIGGSEINQLTISGVEIDNNGASADCAFEGGGFKGVNRGSRVSNNNVHDNNCIGIWYDVNAANNEIDGNRVINNAAEGILYEISQDAMINNNDVEGNGFRTDGGGCSWLWGGGITVASSFNIQIYRNTLSGNCNGITGTQQNRPGNTPPAHLLENISIRDNLIAGSGKTGVAADNGDDLTTRKIVFANNSYQAGMVLCEFAC